MNVHLVMETAHRNVLTLLEASFAIAQPVITWRLMPKPATVRLFNPLNCIYIDPFF